MAVRRTSVQLLALSAMASVGAAPIDVKASTNVVERSASEQCYSVSNVGSFNTHLSIDFTTLSSLPSSLEASTYTVGAGTAPYARQFSTSNIIPQVGQPLQMLVPGGQTTSPIQSAQMTTSYDDVLYGSIRTVAKASSVAGAIHGFFMYYDDNQETDIELRTSDLTAVHFTNQQITAGAGETTYNASAPADMATTFHEYRYDWLSDRCDFYIDSVLQTTFTKNVPSKAGFLMWNNWSNGNTWSAGPPLANSTLEIKSIDAYFNRTSVVVEQYYSCD